MEVLTRHTVPARVTQDRVGEVDPPVVDCDSGERCPQVATGATDEGPPESDLLLPRCLSDDDQYRMSRPFGRNDLAPGYRTFGAPEGLEMTRHPVLRGSRDDILTGERVPGARTSRL